MLLTILSPIAVLPRQLRDNFVRASSTPSLSKTLKFRSRPALSVACSFLRRQDARSPAFRLGTGVKEQPAEEITLAKQRRRKTVAHFL